MKNRAAAAVLLAVAGLSFACSASTRHKVLTFFFDGVPPPRGAAVATQPASAAGEQAASRPAGYREHGPYAARLCNACHDSGATNALVAPRERLCLRCHQLGLEKRYVHGPLISGGCLVCHDPHASPYRALLVSESDGFCLRCHDRDALSRIDGHTGTAERCTTCHEAHMSDKRYLLK